MSQSTLSGRGGLRLAADVYGHPGDAPVVLMHGAGQTRHSWHRAAEQLASSGFHVTSFDHRGHGDSAWDPDGDYHIDAFRDDVRAVAHNFQRPPALVGASLGGVASLLAIAEQDGTPLGKSGVSALVLVDVVARVVKGGAARIRGFMDANLDGFASLDEAAAAISRYMPHRPRTKSNDGLKKNLRLRDDGRWYWHWDPRYIQCRAPNLAERLEAAAAHVCVPTMVIRGENSELVDPAGVELLRQLIPHAETAEVASAHHMVAGDRNDAFNDVVIEFLKRVNHQELQRPGI